MLILTKTNQTALKLAQKDTPLVITEKVKQSGLTGRGGANFLTGLKWEFLRKNQEERILVCNADEGEPGTFKDKFIIENNPELLIEGIHIACYALEASKAYIYLRAEYKYLKENLQKVIDNFKNPIASIKIILGAGAYICGDETSILNSIEGIKPFPRHKPPFPTDHGLYQKPTCINNVETLSNIPLLLTQKNWNYNVGLFSISGDVENPGVFEEKFDITLGELINKAKPKEDVKAIVFGASGGIIPYDEKLSMSAKSLFEKGIVAVYRSPIVIGKSKSIIDVCKNIANFFMHESCGKCFPCKNGTPYVYELLEKISKKQDNSECILLLSELNDYISETSFCGLGQTATNHVKTAFKYFKEEFI